MKKQQQREKSSLKKETCFCASPAVTLSLTLWLLGQAPESVAQKYKANL